MNEERITYIETKLAYLEDFLNQLQEEDKYEMIKEVLEPSDYNFIVTPKEIDDLIENMKDIVARGINFAVN